MSAVSHANSTLVRSKSLLAHHGFLIAILIVATVLRLLLVKQGGQYFFGDERRYDRGIELYNAIRQGNAAVIRSTFSRPEHEGFVLLGAAVTAVQHLCAQITPYGNWGNPANIVFTMKWATGVLAIFSVLNIALLHAVVLALGGSRREALSAACCLALANSAFYFTRHLLPYDSAISFGLAACWVSALHASRRRLPSMLAGGLAAAAYHVYNGYWFLVPVLGALHLAIAEKPVRPARAFWFALGGFAVGTLPLLVGFVVAGGNYWHATVAFSRTVTFGSFAEGWRLPWEYLAHSEGLFGATLVVFTVAMLAAARRSGGIPRFVVILLIAAGASYALLVLFSTVLEIFTVYARTVKRSLSCSAVPPAGRSIACSLGTLVGDGRASPASACSAA